MIQLMKKTFIYFFFSMIIINVGQDLYTHYILKDKNNDSISSKNR